MTLQTRESNLDLRLAARTLLEWGTPPTSPEYQLVLRDLVALHPRAKSWGLSTHSRLLTLDKRGSILWYLSESLSSLPSAYPLPDYDRRRGEMLAAINTATDAHLMERREWLASYGASEERAAWPGGPPRSRLADAIIRASEDSAADVRRAASLALLSIMVPADVRFRLDSVNALLRITGSVAGLITRLVTAIARSRQALNLLATAIGFVSSLAGLVYFASALGFTVSIPFTSTSITIELPQTFSIWVAIGGFALALGTSQLLKYSEKYLVGFAVRLSAGGLEIAVGPSTRAASASTVEVSGIRRRRHRPRPPTDSFIEVLREVSAHNAAVVRSILMADTCPAWLRDLMLKTCGSVSPEVAIAALPVVRFRTLDEPTRESIMKWLCGVRIFDETAARAENGVTLHGTQ